MALAHSQPMSQTPAAGRSRVIRPAKRYPVLPVTLLVLLLVLPALFAPYIAPYNPVKGSLMSRLKPPVWVAGGSSTHWLGTDKSGVIFSAA